MSLAEISLQWPKFCYSGQGSSAFEAPAPVVPGMKRKRMEPQGLASSKIQRLQLNQNIYHHREPPSIDNFAFSNLMKKMAAKYEFKDVDRERSSPKQSGEGALPFPPLDNPFILSYLNNNPFLPLQQQHQSDSALKLHRPLALPLALSNNPLDLSGRPISPSSKSNGSARSVLEDWNIESVSEFVSTVDSCEEYAQVFKDHSIDGSSLPFLSETHLTGILGMKLGPAMRLLKAINKLLSADLD